MSLQLQTDYYGGFRQTNSCALPFDPASLEKIILTLCDKFDFRVVLRDERTKQALIVTAGLTFTGGVIGRYYGENIGTVLGGAIGGVCGLGVIAVTMRDIWKDIKAKLTELYDIVHDYLVGLGLDDYKNVAVFLRMNKEDYEELAMLVLKIASNVLGMKIMSSLTVA